ncbi:MAG TPA: LamG-like jellyroll fold domain-containing protein, partial [Actinoplanes sp.]
KPAPASATDAHRGAGRAPAAAPGTLEPYQPYQPTTRKTVTGDTDPGFDPETSERVAAESSAQTDVYRNEDGSLTHRTYSRATNYRAADGTWKPIDPDLVKKSDGRLHMKANSLKVSVADEAPQGTDAPAPAQAPAPSSPAPSSPAPSDPTPSGPAPSGPAPSGSAPPADARSEDAIPAAPSAPAAAQPAGPADDLARLTLPTGESVGYLLDGAAPAPAVVYESKATYPKILPQTDLELETFDAGIKETLVLHSPDAPSSWVFPLRLDGLTPRQAASGEIELLDADGKVAVRFPKGYMVDSAVDPRSGAPAQSAKVDYELIESGGVPALRVRADEAWLRDPARRYPVRVDPTATTGTTGDVYVDNDADTADHNGDNLPVGTYDGGKTKARSFIHLDDFDTSGVKGKKVTAAKLKLYLTWAYSCETHRPFSVHRVTEKWTVADLPKGGHPGPDISGAIGSLDVTDTNPACKNTGADRAVGKWVTVTLNPATFSDWSSGGVNEGLALTAAEGDSQAWKRFTSANFSSGKFKPQLELTYANNVLPQVNVRYPANNAVVPTLSPELLVRGSDADAYPGKGLTYTFVVYDSAGKVVVNSGAKSSPAWQIPAGKLAWNSSYLWQVQPNDKVANGPAAPLWSFTTAPPQPALTAGLAQNSGKGYDAGIGNYTTSATDASVTTVGPSLAITRSYNSLDTRRAGAFGAGWSSVLDMRVTERLDPAGAVQTLLVTYPTGQELAFGRNADGTFTPPSGRYATMKETTNGTAVTGYTMTDKDASIYWFTRPVAGRTYRLTSVTDANARKLAVAYDAAGNPVKMTGASGRSLNITWSTPAGSTAPHVAEIYTDPVDATKPESATTWKYGYGPDDRLIQVCPPTDWATCWTYGYDTTSQHGNAVLNANPGSYWPLNDTSGVTARSAVLSNAGVDAARYTNVALGRPGALAGSASTSAGFNGTSSHLQLPGDLIADGQYQSISMWFRTTTANGVLFSYNANPITKGTTTSDYTPALYVDKNGRLRGQFWTGGVGPINSNVTVTDGAWHHVVLAGEGDSQTLYLDGVARGTKSGTIAAFSDASAANISVGAGFVGGGWPDHVNTGASPAKATWFAGDISDVAFFNDTLGAPAVTTLRQSGVTAHPVLNKITRPAGGVTAAIAYDKRTGKVAKVTDENNGTWTMGEPVVIGSSDVYAGSVLGAKPTDYWRLGETDASDAVNEVAGGVAGYTDVTLGAGGPFADAKAASFNGTSSYLTLPAEDVPATGPTSIEMWFKQPANSATGGVLFGYQTMPMDEVDAAGSWTPALYVGTDGKLRGGLWTGAAANTITSAAKVNDGKWHHVVLSATTTSQTLYLDGAVAGTRAATVAAFNAAYAYVGAGKWAGTWPGRSDVAGGFFNGSIAELAYYNAALTAEQVAAHQAASKQTVPVAMTMVAGVAKAISMPVSKVLVTGPTGEKLWYSYDLVNGNRVVGQTDALGNETKFGYDVGGYSNLVYDPRGVYTQELQDVRGNTKQTITCQDQSANRCSSVHYSYYPDATTTALTPDARNDLLLAMRDARSSSATDNTYLTSYAYDTKGNQTTVTDPLGRVTRTAYTDGTTPAVGGGVVPAGLPTTVTTPGGMKQTVRYYATGDLAELTDPVGKKVTFSYDGLGRLLTETEVTDTFPNGLVTSHTYDALGRETTVTEPAVTNRVTGAVHTSRTTTVYDADSNVLEVREEDLTGGDAPRVEKHTYNAYGQEVTSTTEGGAVTRFTYDAYGRVATENGAD